MGRLFTNMFVLRNESPLVEASLLHSAFVGTSFESWSGLLDIHTYIALD